MIRRSITFVLVASLASRLCAAQVRGDAEVATHRASSLVEAVARPRPDARPEPTWYRPLGLATLLVGAAGLGVGTVATVIGADHRHRYEGMNCRETWRQNPQCLALKSNAEGVLQPLQVAGFVVGGTLAVAGVALLLYVHEHSAPRWLCAPGVSGVQCDFSF